MKASTTPRKSRATTPHPSREQAKAESAEVLGRHANTGQKDHKGARAASDHKGPSER